MNDRGWFVRLHLPTLAVAAVIVVVWSAVSAKYGAYVLPSPLHVLKGLGDILKSGEVWKHTGASLYRIVIGFGSAVVLSLLLALALKVSVVAEIFGVTSGIGYIMNYSREILATQMVFAWALVMVAVMLAADKLVFDTLARRLGAWR